MFGIVLALTVLTGLVGGWAWVVLVSVCLFGVLLSRWISIWAKVAVGVLLACWWILGQQLATVSSCGYGSYDWNGHKGVFHQKCQVVDPGSSPIIGYMLLILILAILITNVAYRTISRRAKASV